MNEKPWRGLLHSSSVDQAGQQRLSGVDEVALSRILAKDLTTRIVHRKAVLDRVEVRDDHRGTTASVC